MVVPNVTRVTEEICRGFIESLRSITPLNFKFKLFSGDVNTLKLRKCLDTIVDDNFDLIFTVGTTCTVMAKEVITYKRKSLPIVFSSVSNPTQYDIIECERKPGCSITGVAAEPQPRYYEQLELLLLLKPQTKNVLFPFDPVVGGPVTEEEHVKKLETFLNRKNIELTPVSDFNKRGLLEKMEAHMDKVDVVFVGRDNLLMESTDHIVSLCNKNRVTFISSNLYSVEKGAALSFGHAENLMGQAAAHQARSILEHHLHPREIPVITPKMHYKMKINPKTLDLQGLSLDPQLLFLVQHGQLV